MSKPSIHRTILQLKAREYITPNYIRLTFIGTDTEPFTNCTVGTNNKIFIPPKGVNQVYFPDKSITDEAVLKDIAIRRTYTHAGIDLVKQEMYMEFVAHGVEGPASDFAINASIGSLLGVAMKTQQIELVPEVDFYYIVGDATALPVIRAILNTIQSSAIGTVLLEVTSLEDRQEIEKPEGVSIHWIINEKTKEDTLLADAAITYLNANETSDSRFAFIACEYSNVRKMRNYLRKEIKWAREEVSAYSYWKYGVAETKSEIERREEKNSF